MSTWERFLCWLGFHKWGKWNMSTDNNEIDYVVSIQARKCENCGIVQVRVI